MPSTRRSSRLADPSSIPSSLPAKSGSKRKANTNPKEKDPQKSQKTLEETVQLNKDASRDGVETRDHDGAEDTMETEETEKPKNIANGSDIEEKSEKRGINGALVEDKTARDDKIASNIVEKGIIYFFTRGRVNVDEPEGVQDLQRTYFVLRPIPTGAKLGEGPIDDAKHNRLFALPKKVFPRSGKDRFMAFVEKAKASISELKEEFFQGSDYQTKAGDSRHTPAVMPVGEGVYAITQTGRNSHLAYMLTIPKEPGQLQDEIGIHSKGSFVLSLKNPKNKGPANTQLSKSPGFSSSIMEDFGGLAWMPVSKSEYLDYPNAQLLLVGEGQDKFGSATDGPAGEENRDGPEKELEKLEDEDQLRVEKLDGEDAVFEDLHVRKGEYLAVKSTW